MSNPQEPPYQETPAIAFHKPIRPFFATLLIGHQKLNFLRIIIFFFVILCAENFTYAQQIIRGKITGPDGLPMTGVTISKKGSQSAVETDTSGKYSINATKGNTLVFSFIGHETAEVVVGSDSIINVSLRQLLANLDEVVVTGYVTEKVKNIAGSVSIVKPKELTEVPDGQVEQMLQGKVAGLNVITSGEPGAPAQIYLHGIGNFGNVTPLYMIDGVEGDINSINPYDIESIQVLKDAASYSIYGVRGANGVIVVTTKKGKTSRTKISYDFYLGRTQPLKEGLSQLNPTEQANLEWIAQQNSGVTPSDPLYGNGPTPVLPYYLYAGPYVGLPQGDPRADPSLYNINPSQGDIYQIVQFSQKGTDWFHELFKPAISQNHTLTVSGGEKNHYLLSFGYLDQEGTYLNTFLKRFTTRVNTDFLVLNVIHIGENLQLSYSQNPRVGSIDPALTTFPFLPVYDIKGNSSSYGPAGPNGVNLPNPAGNPVTARMLSKDDKYNNWQVFGNAFAEINFLRHFTLRTSFGGPLNYYYSYQFAYGSYQPPPIGYPSNFSEQSGYSNSWTWTNTLNYSGTFKENHHIRVLIGTEEKNNYSRGINGIRYGYASTVPNYRLLSTGSPANQNVSDMASTSYLSSFISQLFYDYREKYFLTGTLRRDASSVFGPDKQYGWFPAVGVAWRISQEDFLEPVSWINELKLRASWGKTGFDGNTTPNNQYTLFGGGAGGSYYDIFGVSSGTIQQGFRPVTLGNPETGWQQDVVTNLGIDAIFWKGKLSITADWYNKNTTGLLMQLTLPAVLGEVAVTNPPYVNIGNLNNTGVDITLGSKGSFSKDFGWDVLATFSHYDNKIVKLNNVQYFDNYPIAYSELIRNEVGYPISSFFGYKVIGLFKNADDTAKSPPQADKAPGRFKFLDANHDGKIDDNDRVHMGNPNPKFTLGLHLGLNYKGIDFSTFFYGSFGNDVYNNYRVITSIYAGTLAWPKGKSALYDSWTPQNTNAKVPIPEITQNISNGQVVTSYGIEKGSYFRNKTLMLGYTLPKTFLQKIHIERLRIYVQALNLFTITHYSGLDPELSGVLDAGGRSGSSSAFGIDASGNYPNNQKQWLIGINLGI
jgi:TonB-linked SusC/RagA family outer membrane protein